MKGNTAMLNRIFVYGTLMAGKWNDREIYAKSRIACHKATIKGRIYAVAAFPGLRLDHEDSIVHGEVHEYLPEMMEKLLPLMDSLEGYQADSMNNHYNRKVVNAKLEDGREVEVYVYEYSRPVPEELRILSGTWTENSRNEILTKQAKTVDR
ncbi:MAG: gamma-glutamylcyclotransferase [Pyrinomonadaceae bacterium]